MRQVPLSTLQTTYDSVPEPNLLSRVPRTFTLYTFVHMQSVNMNALTFLGHQHLGIIPSVFIRIPSSKKQTAEMRWCRQSKYFPTLFPNLFASFSCKKIPMLLEKSSVSLQKLKWYVLNPVFVYILHMKLNLYSVCWWMETVATLANLPHIFLICLLYMRLLFCFLRLRFMQIPSTWMSHRWFCRQLNSDAVCWKQRSRRDRPHFFWGLWRSICPTVDGWNPAPADR